MKKIYYILLIFFLILSSFSLDVGGEGPGINLSGYTVMVIKDADYVLSGNIVLKDNSTLYISYTNFTMFQDYNYQYKIILMDNSTLKIMYSSFNAGKMNIEMSGNSNVYVEDSVMNTEAFVNGTGSSMNVVNSKFLFQSIFIKAEISIENSSLSGASFYAHNSTLNVTNSTLPPTYLFQNTVGDIHNSSLSITCDYTSVVFYYDDLNLRITDYLGDPVSNSTVVIRFSNNNTIYRSYVTDSDGYLRAELPEMIIRNYTDYIGNYNLTLSINNKNFYKNIALRIDGKVTAINWILNEIIYPPITPGNGAIYVKNSLVLNGNNSTYALNENIIVNGGTLIIRNYTIYEENRYIIGNNATLIFENTRVKGKIYGINSKLYMNNSNAGELLFTNSTMDIHGNFNLIYASGQVEIRGNVNNINFTGNGTIENSRITVGDFKGNIEFRNSTIAYLFAKDSHLKFINSGYSKINDKNTEIEKYYWLHIEVRNGHNRLVPTPRVYIYEYNITAQKLIETINATGGIALIYLPAVNEKSGNYIAVAYYNNIESEKIYFTMLKNMNVTIRFKHHVVPPFSISISYSIHPSSPTTNEKIKIEGKAIYETGEPVKNSTVEIKIFNSIYTGKTDETGHFSLGILTPSRGGEYEFTIIVRNESYYITGVQEGKVNVVSNFLLSIYLPLIIGVVTVIGVTLVILVIRRKYYNVVFPS